MDELKYKYVNLTEAYPLHNQWVLLVVATYTQLFDIEPAYRKKLENLCAPIYYCFFDWLSMGSMLALYI